MSAPAPLPDLSGPIDSHCHLQSLAPDERERALDAARERGGCFHGLTPSRFVQHDIRHAGREPQPIGFRFPVAQEEKRAVEDRAARHGTLDAVRPLHFGHR